MYKRTLYIFTFFSVVLFDRITKWFALANLQGKDLQIFPGLNLSFTWNRGVSWGMLQANDSVGLFLLASLIALVIISFLIYTVIEYKSGTFILFELLVLAGASSNFFDRIYYGAVVDFIECHYGAWYWPTFNIADACIVLGIIGIIVRGILCARAKK